MKLDADKTLVFDDKADGHHPEYIRNLCAGAAARPGQSYYFLVSRKLASVMDLAQLSQVPNVGFLFIEDFLPEWNPDLSGLSYSWAASRLINDIAKRYCCKNIILVMLMSAMPFMPFLVTPRCRIRGIIYMIYLYRQDASLFVKMQDRLKYLLFARCAVFDKVLILNDQKASDHFNRAYRTKKFAFLPDPVVPFDKKDLKDLRDELGLRDKKILLHFGCLSRDKGTLDILDFIESCDAAERGKYAFVFAGAIQADIKSEFLRRYELLKTTVEIRVFDSFCAYELLGSLCVSCDYILSPYKRVASSSGVVGYAAQFNRPVIVPDTGLLGHLVAEYGLGFVYDPRQDFTSEMRRVLSLPYALGPNKYTEINNVENFNAVLLS